MKTNRIINGECHDVMRGIDDESVDLIYADPPFNTGKNWGEFDDKWGVDFDSQYYFIADYHSAQMASYISFMAERIVEMRRILKATGSLYLHCYPKSSHYLKLILDRQFGQKRFRNEVIWCYSPAGIAPKREFPRKHDVLFYYSKGDNPQYKQLYTKMTESSRSRYAYVDEMGRRYNQMNGRRMYLDESKGRQVPDYWVDIPGGTQISHNEYLGYPTQKPMKLLKRIIQASSKEGDLVYDPFCGSGTTLVAADILNRKWIGSDINKNAVGMAQIRVKNFEMPLFA